MKPIGIDTNVLLRMVLNDDLAQRAKAIAFGKTLNDEMPGFISLIVLVEFYWALSSIYKQPKAQVLATIDRLSRIDGLILESHDAVIRALERSVRSKVDFADALIAENNLAQGCSHTVTFDRDAARTIPAMELLA